MSLKPEILKEQFVIGKPLHIDLGDGLVLREATLADAGPLGQFNERMFGGEGFDALAAAWTRDLCSERHPTCGPSNITIVEDTTAGGKIVSSMCLIPQTWTFAGIPFDVGRMEAVATDPNYRRRGLVRAQFEIHHARSAAMGHLIQAITGIPWYYRQFGYEYALDLGGGQMVNFGVIPALKEGETEPFRLRPMTLDDLPFAASLYDRDVAKMLVVCPRPEWLWKHMMVGTSTESFENRPFQIIETADGRAIGYLAPSREMGHDLYAINELSIADGESLRATVPCVLRALRALAERQAQEQKKMVHTLFFQLGREHALFNAIPDYVTRTRRVYGWYIRVSDTAAMVSKIAPVLEGRLAHSVMAGHTGELRINEYVNTLKLVFEHGRIIDVHEERANGVTEWQPAFPPRTFLQLLFGFRTRGEVDAAYSDCYSWGDASVLLDALFPKQASWVVPVG